MNTSEKTYQHQGSEIVVIKETPSPVIQIVLNLTERDAKAIFDATSRIGGEPQLSARGVFDAIRRALREGGFGSERTPSSRAIEENSNLYFKEYSEYM